MANQAPAVKPLCFLALDGGGIKGMSELVVLQELMLRLQADQQLPNVPKPCDVFDLIGGTSTGGLIAIMLGRLRMSVDQAIQEFGTFGEKIFSKRKSGWNHEGMYSATVLEAVLKDVVKRYDKTSTAPDEDLKLVDGMSSCKVFVCTRAARALNAPRIFKSYGPFGAADYPDLKIWEAARATSAAPTFFKRISIGPVNQQEDFLDGGLGTNNPSKILLKEAKQAFGASLPVSCFISIGCGESNIIEVREPGFFQKHIPLELKDAIVEMVTDCKQTALEMEDIFRQVAGFYFRFNVEQGLQDVGLEEWKEMGAIKSKALYYLGSKEALVQQAVTSLSSATNTPITVGQLSLTISSSKSLGSTTQRPLNALLKDLCNSLYFVEMHTRERDVKRKAEEAEALENTFDWLLEEQTTEEGETRSTGSNRTVMGTRFRRWVTGSLTNHSQGHGNLFWISGKAASGKSTLMRKICHDPRMNRLLEEWAHSATVCMGKAFFTALGSDLQQSREGLLRTLLYETLATNEKLTQAVLKQFRHKVPERDDPHSKPIQWSWEELQLAFQSLLKQANASQRLFLFIDGLDEYSILAGEQTQSIEYYQDLRHDEDQARRIRAGYRQLAQMLMVDSENQNVKICVSSRPLNEFEELFKSCPRLKLEELTTGDIEAYVLGRVSSSGSQVLYAPLANEVMLKASGVFLWVSIAADILVDGILNGLELSELEKILRGLPSELGGPDGLYMRMVRWMSPRLRSEARRAFDIVLNARSELTSLVLSWAVNAKPTQVVSTPIKKFTLEELRNETRRTDKRIRSYAGLLEIIAQPETGNQRRLREEGVEDRGHIDFSPVVQFIHLTAQEFVMRPDVRDKLAVESVADGSGVDPHTALLSACVLRLKHIGTTNDFVDLWSAIKDGLHYAARAEQSGNPQIGLLDDMDRTVSQLLSEDTDSRVDSPRTINWSPPGWKRELQHWAAYEIQEQGGRNDAWQDNFLSLAVQANLVHYVSHKIARRLQDGGKPGRPLLAYAVSPLFLRTLIQYHDRRGDHLGAAFSSPSMIRLLLDRGADPNTLYSDGPSYDTAAQDTQSAWQWALKNAYEKQASRSWDRNGERWVWTSWKESMQLLLEYGAEPNATIYSYHETPGLSALATCILLSWKHLKRDKSLPRMLIDRGATLQPQELEKIARDCGLQERPQVLQHWLDMYLVFHQQYEHCGLPADFVVVSGLVASLPCMRLGQELHDGLTHNLASVFRWPPCA